VAITVFDEDQGSGPQWNPSLSGLDDSLSGNDVEPLIRAPVPVVGAAFGISRRHHHLRCLGAGVPENYFEPMPELEALALHAD
jgi:hypothetical protein